MLASPFLNGQVDLSKVDFQKIQNQMGNIQAEMLKLAGMLSKIRAEKLHLIAPTETE